MNQDDKYTLTRSDIAQLIHQKIGLSKLESLDVTNAVLTKIEKALLSGDVVKIANFGTLKLHQKPACVGRIIHKDQAIIIPPKRVVKFSPSPNLNNRVNTALIAQQDNHSLKDA